jgi:hypothetical protein
MKRLTLRCSDLGTIAWAIFAALVFTCVTATIAFAQHSPGPFGGVGHLSSPAASHPGVSRPVTPVRPPTASPAPRTFLVRPPVSGVLPARGCVVGYPYPHHPIAPIRPRRPIRPIGFLPPPGFGVFGIPFFGLGFGWGLGPGLWLGCDPFWISNYGCNGLSPYGYGPEYAAPSLGLSYSQPQTEIQNWPAFYVGAYGEAYSQYVQLYLRDGTAYNVTDYWLVNGQLHFKTVEGNGAKVVEHEIDFGLLDLQMTIDVNTQRGFRFVLRNEPLEQYLRDRPSTDSPDEAPTNSAPAQP